MSDQTIIDQAIIAHETGETISDLQARVIASTWHSGQSSPLYALASSGAVLESVESELLSLSAPEIDALTRYCVVAGFRGPVPGWSRLTW